MPATPEEAPAPDAAALASCARTIADRACRDKPEEFWPRVAEELTRVFSCERATIFQARADGRLISCYAQGVASPIMVDKTEGIAGRAAFTRQLRVCNDPYHDPEFSRRADQASRFKTKNLLAFPLIARDKTAGVVELINKEGGFSSADVRAAEFLGPQLCVFFMLFRVEGQQDQLTQQLMQMEKMAAIGRLVSGLAHEIRSPLSVIVGYTEKLQRDAKNIEGIPATVARIDKAVRRIESLIKNLLGFSRQSKTTMASVDLAALLDETLEILDGEIKKRGVEVVKDFDAATPRFTGNPNTLKQVFVNLITNALHAMDGKTGARVTLKLRPSADGSEALAEVSDNGPGVPEEIADKIFEPFFTTKGAQGTGLGLYVVLTILQNHKARIALDSAPGRGATFRLAFPARRQA